jgi:hypothetical protein
LSTSLVSFSLIITLLLGIALFSLILSLVTVYWVNDESGWLMLSWYGDLGAAWFIVWGEINLLLVSEDWIDCFLLFNGDWSLSELNCYYEYAP